MAHRETPNPARLDVYDERGVTSAWEHFLSGDQPAGNAVRHLIRDSWSRCQHAGVDPGIASGRKLLNLDFLASHKLRHEDLLHACKPVMVEARDFLAESGTVMLLTDPSGLILELEGDRAALDDAHAIDLQPGARWREEDCGTNAIGTALSTGAAVQVHAAEHFCEGIKRWTCSATVIRDPYDGDLLGALDVSGLSSTFNRHSLALVVAAATRIEQRLGQLNLESRQELLEHCLSLLPRFGAREFLVFDRAGRLVKASDYAVRTLKDHGIRAAADGLPRLAELGFERPTEAGDCALPSGARAEWLQPFEQSGRQLGNVLLLPARTSVVSVPRRATPVRPRDAAAFTRLIGESSALRSAVERANRLARARVPMLLLGETGVGKELFARAIHAASPCAEGPMVSINCGGLSRDLLASELFGYVDGAFTGARRGGMKGKIEAADGGTLFLDEIGDMPLDLQPHLLRVLEDGEVYRLGDTQPRRVRFRLLAATNRDLHGAVEAGQFRMDLFYRVSVTSLDLPSLRERRSDILALAGHFAREIAAEHGLEQRGLADDALEALLRYDWPGNVRELRNVIESLVLTAGGESLVAADLPAHLRRRAPAASAVKAAIDTDVPAQSLAASESEAIRAAVVAARGNLAGAARALGISKSTLYAKLRRYGHDELVVSVRNSNA
ncbi:MAG: sigma-54-dependent Fis family transcriptional regulator [Gammaproteobacteria bacterium]